MKLQGVQLETTEGGARDYSQGEELETHGGGARDYKANKCHT